MDGVVIQLERAPVPEIALRMKLGSAMTAWWVILQPGNGTAGKASVGIGVGGRQISGIVRRICRALCPTGPLLLGFILLNTTQIEKKQANLQCDERICAIMQTPSDPQCIAQHEQPETRASLWF